MCISARCRTIRPFAKRKPPTSRRAEVKPQARATLLPGLTSAQHAQQQFSDSRGGALVPGGIGHRHALDLRSIDRDSWSIGLTQTIFDWASTRR